MAKNHRPLTVDSGNDTTTVMKKLSGGGNPRSKRSSGKQKINLSSVDFTTAPKNIRSRLESELQKAAEAFSAERFKDAKKSCEYIEERVYEVPEVLELHGLTCYRLGMWQEAVNKLEKFESIVGSVEQHPVIADCYRALKRWNKVAETWENLGSVSPSPDLIEEGRIVMVGSLIDQGNLKAGLKLIERAPSVPQDPNIYHIRRLYVQADLYERLGDHAKARRVFKKIVKNQKDFADAAERLASLA